MQFDEFAYIANRSTVISFNEYITSSLRQAPVHSTYICMHNAHIHEERRKLFEYAIYMEMTVRLLHAVDTKQCYKYLD